VIRTVGDSVSICDLNGATRRGEIISIGQANDGTGRHGYWVRVDNDTYWRAPKAVRS
jgi:hypothetical protein